MSVATFTKSGTKAATPAKLNKAIFAVDVPNHELLKAAYVAYLANGRTSAGNTKTRGLVSGGGRKPWKQKGTGRARFGSSRNPIWRGGGIVFGPTGNENYSHNLSTKTKRVAVRQALTLAAQEGRIIVIEAFGTKEPSVNPLLKLLDKLGVKGNTLLVGSEKNDTVRHATDNLPNVTAQQAMYLNTYIIMNADTIVISQDALKIIDGWLAPGLKASKKEGGDK